MLDWAHPLALAGLAAVPLIWWLHRWELGGREIVVSALFLWPTRSGVGGGRRRLRKKPDPSWRLRALLFSLLVLAAAGPRWHAAVHPAVEVWFDDSLSLLTREEGRTRADAAVDRLSTAMQKARPARVIVRSLRRQGNSLSLTGSAPDQWRNRLKSWLRPTDKRGTLPPASALGTSVEHWLVTDGADSRLAPWASAARLTELLQVGRETENVALTSLALRRLPGRPGHLAALLRVDNTGRGTAERTLDVLAGDVKVLEKTLRLDPGKSLELLVEAEIGARTQLQAQLSPPDALPEDDSLSVDTDRVLPAPVSLDRSCGPRLRAALDAHPGLRVMRGGTETPALLVSCAPSRPVEAPPWVWFRPAAFQEPPQPAASLVRRCGPPPGPWALPNLAPAPPERETEGAPLLSAGEKAVITLSRQSGTTRGVEVSFDPEGAELTGRPEYPALVAGLLDTAAGRTLFDPIAEVHSDPRAHGVAPTTLSKGVPRPSVAELQGARDLSVYVLLCCGALALVEIYRVGPGRPRLGRAVLLGAILLALWNPGLPGLRHPIDAIVLWDDSASAQGSARDGLWKTIADSVLSLPRGSRFALVRFASRPVVEVPLQEIAAKATRATVKRDPSLRAPPVDPTSTDIEAALDVGLGLASPDRATSLLLVSDGLQTWGDAEKALREARASGKSVLACPAEAGANQSGTWIQDVHIPARGKVGTPIEVTTTLRTRTIRQGKLSLYLDGTLADQLPLRLNPGFTKLALLKGLPRRAGSLVAKVAFEGEEGATSSATQRSQTVAVEGPPRVVFVSSHPEDSPLRRSLAAGGWRVEDVRPGNLGQTPEELSQAPLLILDDIAVSDAPPKAWDSLDRAVRVFGSGLLLLGGPHSFAAGGYRGSKLEALLPVLAEPSGRLGRTAAVFVVDTSGSMGQDMEGGASLDLATASLEASAATLPRSALVGLISFDVEARELLPLASYAHPAQALLQAGTRSPRGGTRALPALSAAINRLSAARAERRLLVLLTDGHLGDSKEELSALADKVARSRIDLICVGLGSEVRSDILGPFARAAHGSLLLAGKTGEVPNLLRRELAGKTASSTGEEIAPRTLKPLPFFPGRGPLPPLHGYCVSRAKPDASLYLESPSGDPLLATGRAGSGAVAVLPGGLGPWAARWSRWPHWPRFAGGLVSWVSRKDDDPLLSASVRHRPGELVVEADSLTPELRWTEPEPSSAEVVTPSGDVQELALAAVAPGRTEGVLEVRRTGRYDVTVNAGGRSVRRSLLIQSGEEAIPGNGDAWAKWADEGLVRRWSPGDSLSAGAHGKALRPNRALLSGLCGCLLLGLLFRERLGWPRPRRG